MSVTQYHHPGEDERRGSAATSGSTPTAEGDRSRNQRKDKILFVLATLSLLLGLLSTAVDIQQLPAFQEFAHAWSIWAGGTSAAQEPLWGHSVLFWARLGKVLQFCAGLVVVLDLIGPERLRGAGRSMAAYHQGAGNGMTQLRRSGENRRFAVAVAGALLLPALAAGVVLIGWLQVQTGWGWMLSTPVVMVVGGTNLFLVWIRQGESSDLLWGSRWLIGGLVLIFAYATAKPAAIIFDKANPGHVLRWASLLVFASGFLFDLLGS